MKALITGGAGFIGLHLARSLAEDGTDVVIADNFQRGREDDDMTAVLQRGNVTLQRADITNSEEVMRLGSGYDHVYHLAALNGTENFYTIPDKVLQVGATGTLNVLEWFSSHNKEGKLLFSSSSEAYAGLAHVLGDKFPIPTPENVPLAIADPRNVRWSYGASKLLGEVAMYSYAKARGFKRFAIMRYHNIYGPRMGNEHVIPQFIGRLLKKENPFAIYGGEETRSFCYVDDAVTATKLVMQREETNGKIVHIGRDDAEINIKELAKKLFSIAGTQPEVRMEQAPEGAVQRRCPDITTLKSLGWTPATPLNEGLWKTWEWYKQQ